MLGGEMLGALDDAEELSSHLAVHPAVLEQGGCIALDGGERGSQLVRHGPEQLVLETVELLEVRDLTGVLLQALPIDDQRGVPRQRRDESLGRVRERSRRGALELDDADGAVAERQRNG